jgi:hypothetical protein
MEFLSIKFSVAEFATTSSSESSIRQEKVMQSENAKS